MIRQAVSLPRLKLNVLEVDDATIPGIYESIRTIGGGGCAAASRGALRRHRRQAGGHPAAHVAAAAQRGCCSSWAGRPDRIEDLIAAGGSSYLNEVMRIAGGENVFQRRGRRPTPRSAWRRCWRATRT